MGPTASAVCQCGRGFPAIQPSCKCDLAFLLEFSPSEGLMASPRPLWARRTDSRLPQRREVWGICIHLRPLLVPAPTQARQKRNCLGALQEFPGWRIWGSLSVTTGMSCRMRTFPNFLPSLRGASTHQCLQREVCAHSAVEGETLQTHFSNFSHPLKTEALFKRKKN